MITTVTLNPAVDQTIIVDQYQLGQIHRVKVRRMDV
ncbi:MAG: 1-phosphofructokinase, partial [Epulopiscium sp.]|nr:1-phosphofructokinase [Candidatus Epulonipiscium sp.]